MFVVHEVQYASCSRREKQKEEFMPTRPGRPRKTAAARKTTRRKSATRKTAARKSVARKSVARKTAGRKTRRARLQAVPQASWTIGTELCVRSAGHAPRHR